MLLGLRKLSKLCASSSYGLQQREPNFKGLRNCTNSTCGKHLNLKIFEGSKCKKLVFLDYV